MVILAVGLVLSDARGQLESLQKIPTIERVVPPKGLELSSEKRAELIAKLTKVELAYGETMQARSAMVADIAVLIKAVQYAIHNGEFYKESDFEKVDALLALAEERIGLWSVGEMPWERATGLVVRGLFSKIEGAPQPYAVEIPEGFDFDKPAPLYVWLHGRGDKTTDLHFLYERMRKASTFAPQNGILIHPFGRQCIGYKSAGETDVLEIIRFAKTAYNVDPDRVVLMGFSMGGAGAWHLGAHFTDQFCAVHAGAGFAETAKYNRLKPEQYPPVFEQILWKQYDVPNYARNFLNVPVIAYSGEIDKQKQAADVMAAALLDHGHTLKHVIGPETGHKYHPESAAEIKSFIEAAVVKGRDRYPQNVSLQTPTLRYNHMHWVKAHGLQQHWIDSRIDASYDNETQAVEVKTKNISRFEIDLPFDVSSLTLNGTKLDIFEKNDGDFFIERTPAGEWINFSPDKLRGVKKPGLQGPIDDAFTDSFLVVLQSESSGNPLLDRWIRFEFEHFDKRWYELFRGSFRHKKDTEVTMEDLKTSNLILFGTNQSNKVWEQLDRAAKSDPNLAWPGVGEASTVVKLKASPVDGSDVVTAEQLGILEATLRTRLQPDRQPNGTLVQGRGVDGIDVTFKDWKAEDIEIAKRLLTGRGTLAIHSVKPGSVSRDKDSDSESKNDANWQETPIWGSSEGAENSLQISSAPIVTSADLESATPTRGVGQLLQLDLELSASGRKLLKDFTEDPTHAQHQLAVTLDKKVLQFPVVKSPHGMKVSVTAMSRDDLLEIFDTIRIPLPCDVQLVETVVHPGRDRDTTVVSMIYPNPLAPDRYVVFNSGPTFREGHDRTNSLQNPKLPDWAIIDLTQIPNATSPGKVLSAGFFDEHWQLSREQTFEP